MQKRVYFLYSLCSIIDHDTDILFPCKLYFNILGFFSNCGIWFMKFQIYYLITEMIGILLTLSSENEILF